MGKAHDVSDPKAVAAEEKRQRLLEIEQKRDLQYVMADPAGRRFVWRVLGRGFAGVEELSFTQKDASMTAFKEGMRNVGNLIREAILMDNVDLYLQMELEARKGENQDG